MSSMFAPMGPETNKGGAAPLSGCHQKDGERTGNEAAVAAMEHGRSNAIHDRLCLDVEVSVELVGAPPADEADAVAIDPRTHEGHGAAGAS
jgi:hypothetical protein